MNKFLEKIKKLLKQKTVRLIIIAMVIVIVFILGIWLIMASSNDEEISQTQIAQTDDRQEEKICEYARQLDGVCVEEGQDNLPVYAVMIENHSLARPQSGLNQASVVYEAIAEGGITRFLAVFDSSVELEEIGPVRSARTYFLDWAQEFDSLYVHIGGSPESLELLKVRPVFDLNQFFNGPYFWRAPQKTAPHDVYTSSELLAQAVEDKEWKIEPDYDSWLFKKEAELQDRGELQAVKIDFLSSYYSVNWYYDQENNIFTRNQGGYLHEDSDSENIATKNLVVMYSKSYIIPNDDKDRRYQQTVGQGKAFVFLDGQVIEGGWQRDELSDRTRFYNENEEEIQLNIGKTWIEVLPNDYPLVSYE